ncbi:multi-sensor signal transduction histidine kinase [Arcobacter nitrofigilis DSM 7299]|uniref:histidine kinase n=1 Tax=Arcobacter nitrofigilis (strain ATCC 33309 / DSM 7299 / CCUG 15893 / LMG 7604 / NCTC 12251 / CI) TaxID=572480 RepID=D5V4Y2_ARCNC|nr:cache domain-containing protein [Arcobacter nitrofigilis]ADG91944.1 multi-sensor signal transduction histidine kinase [Arcobacter nitrofigilis DSM 7299]
MKNNYNQTVEQGIKKTTLLSSTIIILIVATIIGIVLIKTEYSNFRTHIKSFKNTLIEREMFYVKTSVQNLKNDIDFESLSIINSKKQRIKNQSIIAYNLAYSLYKSSKNLSKEEQIDLIEKSLKEIAQEKNDINYFILNTKGTLLLNTDYPKNEGINFLDFEDLDGVKFINKMINANPNTQNFLDYNWYRPNKRITYSRHLKELGLIIGSASNLESNHVELTDKLLKKITLQGFNNDEFIFIYKINSLTDIMHKSKLLIQKNIITSNKELEAIKELLIKTNYKANEATYYDYNQKLFYATYIKEYRYFIAVGVNLSNINQIVKKETKISLDNLYKNIIKLIIIIIVMTIVFFFFSLLFTRKIEELFNQYRKRVKQNEEKYALLFNYSNDGFIISEIINNSTRILSLNSTALKTIGYESSEILYKDFFNLFDQLSLEEIKQSKSLVKTVKLFTKDKQTRTIELNAIIYSYENQNLLFASLRDITERTLLKEEKIKQQNILIQKSKMAAMGEMIGNIAHQWRQPLSQVSGLFFDIESAYDYKELDKKYLQNRVDEANDLLEYMSKTIDDFRNFFNPNSKKELFYLNEAIDNALKIVKSTLTFHHIELIINIEEDYKIDGYKNEYSQAIMNILSNAKDILLEKNIQNPQIKIYAQKNEKLCLHIEDNAGGIDDTIINKIFDPYFTTKYDYGTGIGLYMTKMIIEEKMNGTISVKNSHHGAIFSIEI